MIKRQSFVGVALAGVTALSCTSPPAVPPVAVPAPQSVSSRRAAATVYKWRPANARLLTRWAADVTPENAHQEYPRPQMTRERWQNLNGLWQFEVVGDSGRALVFGRELTERILVPFAMESSLSGIGRHADRVVYRRIFARPAMNPRERLLLNFGAVDWETRVYVNGREVGFHQGGYDPFTFDITPALLPGAAQELVVSVYDPTDKFGQPRGKQVSNPGGIWYTPVTGIWQTVWLEPVPAASIASLAFTPDVDGGSLRITVHGRGTSAADRVEAVASSNGATVGRIEGPVGTELKLPVPNAHLWSPDDPFLYDLRVSLRNGSSETDRVDSYFGMRKVGLARDANGFTRIALNGKPVFQLGPLDQGW